MLTLSSREEDVAIFRVGATEGLLSVLGNGITVVWQVPANRTYKSKYKVLIVGDGKYSESSEAKQ